MYADKEHQATREIEDGFYTVVTGNSFSIFRIQTHDAEAKHRPGQQVIAKAKDRNPRTFSTFGVIQEGQLVQTAYWKDPAINNAVMERAKRLLESDMEEAGRMYARTTHRCYVCNKPLRVQDSLETGIGPNCAGTRKHREIEPQESA